MKKTFSKSVFVFLPFAALITFACLLGYGLVQQSMRMDANDPQIQAAQDVARDLSEGAPPDALVPPGQTVDMSQTLDPYVIIYDNSGVVLASSAVLNGVTPSVPAGVFSYVTQHGEDRFTWQPSPDVRQAAVVDAFTNASSSGYVLAGRSINEVESREAKILHDALIAWVFGLIVMFLVVWFTVAGYEKMFHKTSQI